MDHFKIRAHQPADKSRLLTLLRLNTPTYFSPAEEADLIDYLAHHADNYFVLEVGGEILGCGGFNLSEDGETAKISWDIFHPDSHGKGLIYKFYEKFGLELREVVKDYWDVGFDLYRLDIDINLINLK